MIPHGTLLPSSGDAVGEFGEHLDFQGKVGGQRGDARRQAACRPACPLARTLARRAPMRVGDLRPGGEIFGRVEGTTQGDDAAVEVEGSGFGAHGGQRAERGQQGGRASRGKVKADAPCRA
jgi:hypothetical protein